ncbi:MAG TPA: TonB-dependent receptor [Candidatus Elarobacter sp.]
MHLALLLAAAVASPSPSPSAAPLGTIGTVRVVTGSPQSLHRAPQAASVLDPRLLREQTAPALDAALRVVPGVDRDRSNAPFTNYGQLRLSFNGAGTDRGTLLVDGVPAQDGFGGQVDWNVYPAASIERGELLRGPGSALYGSGAIGGALSLTTRGYGAREGELDASLGGIDVGSGTLGVGVATASGATTFTLATRRFSYNVVPPGQTSAVDRPAIGTADVAHVVSRWSSDAGGAWRIDLLDGDDAQQDGRPNDGFSRALRQIAVSWGRGARDPLSITTYARETTVVNLGDRYPTAPGALLYTQHVPSSDAGVRLRWDVPLGAAGDPSDGVALLLDHRFVTGESVQNAASGVVQSDVAGTQRLDGVALQRSWTGRLGGVAGVRYDTVTTEALGKRDAAALSPRLALRYDASPATALRAAFGTGLRAPFLNELVRSFKVGAVTELNNPNLVPERSRSLQLGIDVVHASDRFAFDYTATQVRNAIGFATIGTNLQQRANFGRTVTDAYVAEYDHPARCSRLHAFATAQHDRVAASTNAAQIGKRLAYVPDAAAALDVERSHGNLTGALEVAYSGPTFADDLQQQPLGSTVLLGARLTLRGADGETISLAFDNLADARYLTTVDRLGPPASLTVRVTVPVGTRALSAARAGAVCG